MRPMVDNVYLRRRSLYLKTLILRMYLYMWDTRVSAFSTFQFLYYNFFD